MNRTKFLFELRARKGELFGLNSPLNEGNLEESQNTLNHVTTPFKEDTESGSQFTGLGMDCDLESYDL